MSIRTWWAATRPMPGTFEERDLSQSWDIMSMATVAVSIRIAS
jgi:hypothetical protein